MSDARDRRLGMDRGITRRDFLNGMALTVGASLTRPSSSFGRELVDDAPEKAAGYYPPALTGLRGSHEGSYAAAKGLIKDRGIDGGRWERVMDGRLYGSMGLRRGVFFDKETFGADRLLPMPGRGGDDEGADSAAAAPGPWARFMAEAPMTERA